MTAISSCIVFLVVIINFFLLDSNIYQGVKVEGMNLSGYNHEDATQLLKVWQEERRNRILRLDFGGKTFQLVASTIDFNVDISDALDAAWHYGRKGTWWERIKKIRDAHENGHNIFIGVTYDEVKLNHIIEQWQSEIERPAHNATFSMMTGKITPEELGYRLEVDVLRPLILQSLIADEDTILTLPVTTLYPKVTNEDLAHTGIHKALSVYTTIFNSQDANRASNIKLAVGKVNGYLLQPGEKFSFNEIVGPREKSSGFKEAMEIMDGEFVPGVGGGICQLSSTLYNAVILANLHVIERYNHSKALSYVPLGRDATVAFGVLDFKFANDTLRPLMIVAETHENELTVGIFGEQALLEKVEIIAKDQEEIMPTIIKEPDNSLYLGETKLERLGKPGVALTIMRVVRLHGKVIKQELLSKDIYPAEDSLLKVGTKLLPFIVKDQ